MALKRNDGISALLVLILGLVSCSKDKEVVYEPQRVQTGAVGALDSQKRMIPAKDIQQLELGDHLTVDLLQEQDFEKNPLLIKTEAHCTSNSFGDTGSYQFYFQNKTSIPVLRLLSENALLSVSEQPLICNITMRISNSLSSEEIYLLKSVKIIDSPQFSNLALFQTDTAEILFESVQSTILPKGDIYTLKCHDFQKMLATDQEVSWQTLMDSSATDMSSWNSSQQRCRLLIQSKEQLFLSSPFKLFFNPQPLVLETQIHRMQTALGAVTDRTVLSLRVMNPNSYPIVLKVQDLDSSAFVFKAVMAAPGPAGHLGNERSAPLLWTFQQHLFKSEAHADSWTFELPPNQELYFYGTFKQNLNCQYAQVNRPPALVRVYHGSPVFVGLKFGFLLNTKFLTQVSKDSWSDNPLKVGALAPLASESLPFWDLHFTEVRSFFGAFFKHPSTTNEDFMSTINDTVYDVCTPN